MGPEDHQADDLDLVVEDDEESGRKLFLGWIYEWQRVPLSKTHPDWEDGATVLVGIDDDGARITTSKVVAFTEKTVETEAGRWRLGAPK